MRLYTRKSHQQKPLRSSRPSTRAVHPSGHQSARSAAIVPSRSRPYRWLCHWVLHPIRPGPGGRVRRWRGSHARRGTRRGGVDAERGRPRNCGSGRTLLATPRRPSGCRRSLFARWPTRDTNEDGPVVITMRQNRDKASLPPWLGLVLRSHQVQRAAAHPRRWPFEAFRRVLSTGYEQENSSASQQDDSAHANQPAELDNNLRL